MEPELGQGISPVSPRKARKRPSCPEKWKRNVAKKLRLVGLFLVELFLPTHFKFN